MKYHYFISYACIRTQIHPIVFGNLQLYSDRPICNLDDVNKIEERLMDENGLVEVRILSWQRFEDPE